MEIDKLYVHGDPFHLDDVICAAMVKTVNPNVKIERVNDVPNPLGKNEIVADIGRGKYDHHQQDAEKRPDGRKYSACGLLFRDLKDQLFPNGVPKDFERDMISIQDHDNGEIPLEEGNGKLISGLTFLINPEWDAIGEAADGDKQFDKAVAYIKENYLDQYIELGCLPEEKINLFQKDYERLSELNKKAEWRAVDFVNSAIKNMKNKIVVLDKYLPWENLVVPTEAEYVIYPSSRGGYALYCVPVAVGSHESKNRLPEKWLSEKPDGMFFIHNKRFIASFDTPEQAISAINNYRAQEKDRKSLISFLEKKATAIRYTSKPKTPKKTKEIKTTTRKNGDGAR